MADEPKEPPDDIQGILSDLDAILSGLGETAEHPPREVPPAAAAPPKAAETPRPVEPPKPVPPPKPVEAPVFVEVPPPAAPPKSVQPPKPVVAPLLIEVPRSAAPPKAAAPPNPVGPPIPEPPKAVEPPKGVEAPKPIELPKPGRAAETGRAAEAGRAAETDRAPPKPVEPPKPGAAGRSSRRNRRRAGAADEIPASTPKDQIRRVAYVYTFSCAEARAGFATFLSQAARTISKKPIFLRQVMAAELSAASDPFAVFEKARDVKAVAVLAVVEGWPPAKIEGLSEACARGGILFRTVAPGDVQKKSTAVDVIVDMMLLSGEA